MEREELRPRLVLVEKRLPAVGRLLNCAAQSQHLEGAELGTLIAMVYVAMVYHRTLS